MFILKYKSFLINFRVIAIHNFPEGLATFAAAVQDPAAGVVFAIAVGGKMWDFLYLLSCIFLLY